MIEEQRAKYQRSLDKMSAEQQAEFIRAVEIMNRLTSIKIVTIKGQKYYVVTYVDTEGNKEKNMKRLLILLRFDFTLCEFYIFVFVSTSCQKTLFYVTI